MLQKVEYSGTVWALSHNDPEPLVEHSIKKIQECGIKKDLKIVDLTGAGDLFASGFLHGYVNKLTIKESLEKGTEMSSKVIQQIGARL